MHWSCSGSCRQSIKLSPSTSMHWSCSGSCRLSRTWLTECTGLVAGVVGFLECIGLVAGVVRLSCTSLTIESLPWELCSYHCNIIGQLYVDVSLLWELHGYHWVAIYRCDVTDVNFLFVNIEPNILKKAFSRDNFPLKKI